MPKSLAYFLALPDQTHTEHILGLSKARSSYKAKLKYNNMVRYIHLNYELNFHRKLLKNEQQKNQTKGKTQFLS